MKRYYFYIDLLDANMNIIDSIYDHRCIRGSNDDEIYWRATEFYDITDTLDVGPLRPAQYFRITDWEEAAQ